MFQSLSAKAGPPDFLNIIFLSVCLRCAESFLFHGKQHFLLETCTLCWKKKKKKLKSHGKCSRSTGNCCARFPLGLDLYTSADLNNNFTWGQAKNLVFSPRVAAADLLNKSEQTNQLLLKFPVAHGQWVTPMQWHSSLIGILHYYWLFLKALAFFQRPLPSCSIPSLASNRSY